METIGVTTSIKQGLVTYPRTATAAAATS